MSFLCGFCALVVQSCLGSFASSCSSSVARFYRPVLSCTAVCDGRFVFAEFGFRDSVFPIACRGDFLVRCVLIRPFLRSYEVILILFLIVKVHMTRNFLLAYSKELSK